MESSRYHQLVEALLEHTNEGTLPDWVDDFRVTEVPQQRLARLGMLAAVGELVSGVAHEINNHMAIIIGYSELLMKKISPDIDGEELQITCDQAQRALRLLDELRSLTRSSESPKYLADIRDPIERVLRLRAYRLRVNNIKVVLDLPLALPMTLGTDQEVGQLFLNLVTNAEQSITTGNKEGQLTIRGSIRGDLITVTVEDDGHGIEPEHLDKIFDPFFSTRPDDKSAGLGLSICRIIATRYGGEIRVETRPGHGASFHVDLPVGDDSPPEPTISNGYDGDGNQERSRHLYVTFSETDRSDAPA